MNNENNNAGEGWFLKNILHGFFDDQADSGNNNNL